MPQPIVMGVSESNISVPVGRITEGHKITLYPLKNWADYKWFVRKVKNREFDAATVVLDSYTVIGTYVVNEAMSAPAATTQDGNLKQARWTGVASDQFTELLDLLGSTQPLVGKPSYHIAVTVHEQEEAVYDPEGKMTGISAINPAVPGGFRRSFGAKFDCIFLTRTHPKLEKVGAVNKVTGADHIMWTVAPDRLYSAKDGIGGNGGRKVLPVNVPNSWDALVAAWDSQPKV